MGEEGCERMTDIDKHWIMLEKAEFARQTVMIATKERGQIVGVPHSVDEFESDPDRLGYNIEYKPHYLDTVFFDEITLIEIINTETPLGEVI